MAAPEARKAREVEFHDRLYRDDAASLEEGIYREDFVDYLRERALGYLGDLAGRRLLFYGCGVQLGLANCFYSQGADIVMVDISGEAVRLIERRIRETGQTDRIRPVLMDCEALAFGAESFDVVFGNAIIHHLDTRRAVVELHRVMRRGGRAAFIEPLGSNPLINAYRRLTPGLRTADEHPLTQRDWESFEGRFAHFRHQDYTFLTLIPVAVNALAALARVQVALRTHPFRRLDEYILNRIPWLGSYCWNTVIHLEK